MIPRETATHAADLPHEYVPVQRASVCDVCHAGAEDPRHSIFAQAQLADRERASTAGIPREFGS
jgi:hypothetical protein